MIGQVWYGVNSKIRQEHCGTEFLPAKSLVLQWESEDCPIHFGVSDTLDNVVS